MIITYKRRYKTVKELSPKGLISTTQQPTFEFYNHSKSKSLDKKLNLIVERVQAPIMDNRAKIKRDKKLVIENERLRES